ncbi:GlxA family transcriptional regulator [Algirhabdus cladophorae]|uniref:GlxA family transcriptional regulator n=1 Tax=Algirhabdus cladophorae TaxID=3377108 RepID=UPI003B846FA4
MPSIHAKTVLFVVYPNVVLLDLSGPLQVFTHAGGSEAYETHVVSLEGGQIETNTVLPIETEPMQNWLGTPIHTLIVVGGDGAFDASKDGIFLDHLTRLASRAQRVCSVCSGAIVLAAAGVLDGRRAVTHWEDCDYLAAHFPKVQVEVDPIFVKDGTVWTSAGITAGIDMALAMIEEDLGKNAAIVMARSLVTPMVRSGGQSQFSAELDRQAKDTEGRFDALHAWVRGHIQQQITVEDMAKECGMSPRNFSRRYTQTMGVPPAKAVEAIRVNAARDLLATTSISIQTVASDCGFQDGERMRRAFMRVVKTTPSQYHSQFQMV